MTDPALARVVVHFTRAVVRHDAATAIGSGSCGRETVALFGGIPLLSLAAAVAADVVQLHPVHAAISTATSIENLLTPLPHLKTA